MSPCAKCLAECFIGAFGSVVGFSIVPVRCSPGSLLDCPIAWLRNRLPVGRWVGRLG